MNKEINWSLIKQQLKEEFQIEDWDDWGRDKRVSNILDSFISIKHLITKQLKHEQAK